MLNAAQIEAYGENGYLTVDAVLTPTEVEELRQITDEFVDKSRSVTSNDDIFDLEPGHSATSPSLRRIKHPVSRHPVYAKYARHECI